MAKIEININNQFNAKLEAKELVDDLEKVLSREMQEAAGEIVKRTQSGQSADGGAFAQYTEGYKKYKQKKGRTAKVDLTFSGQMLQAIQTKIEKGKSSIEGVIYFLQQRGNRGLSGKGSTITNSALARIQEQTRPFFALSKKQIDKIVTALKKK